MFTPLFTNLEGIENSTTPDSPMPRNNLVAIESSSPIDVVGFSDGETSSNYSTPATVSVNGKNMFVQANLAKISYGLNNLIPRVFALLQEQRP